MRGCGSCAPRWLAARSVDSAVDEAAAGRLQRALRAGARPRRRVLRVAAGAAQRAAGAAARTASIRSRACSRARAPRGLAGARLGQRPAVRALRAAAAAGHVLARHPEWVMVPRSAAARVHCRAARGSLRIARQHARRRRRGLLPLALRAGCRRAPRGGRARAGAPVPGGRPAPRLHPLPRPGLRLLAGGAGGVRAAPGGTRDRWTPAAPIPPGWAAAPSQRADALAARSRARRAPSGPASLVSAAVVPDEAQALQPPVPGLAGLGRAGAARRRLPDGLHRGRAHLPRAGRAGPRRGSGPRAACGPASAPIGSTSPAIVEKVQLARQAGAAGVVLFSHESLRGQDLDRLRREAFAAHRGRAARAGRAHRGDRPAR